MCMSARPHRGKEAVIVDSCHSAIGVFETGAWCAELQRVDRKSCLERRPQCHPHDGNDDSQLRIVRVRGPWWHGWQVATVRRHRPFSTCWDSVPCLVAQGLFGISERLNPIARDPWIGGTVCVHERQSVEPLRYLRLQTVDACPLSQTLKTPFQGTAHASLFHVGADWS